MQVTFDSVIGTFFGIFVRTILDLIFEKFSGKDFSKYIQANVRKKLSRDMELEINRILQTVLRSNEYSLDRLNSSLDKPFLPDR